MLPRCLVVRRRWREAPRVVTLEIAAEAEPGVQPGQFNMLTAFGVGEAAISLSGTPAASGCLIHTIRAVGPVSTALTRLAPGDAIGLRGPFGAGWPIAALAGHDVVIIAGGLGLAPLRPAIEAVLAARPLHGRVTLLYGIRGPGDMLFRGEIARWGRRRDIDVEVVADHAGPAWRGHVGVVTALLPQASFDPSRTRALLCGPEVMMRRAAAMLADAGVAPEAIHLSLERRMECGVGLCGRCQFGPHLLCRDGPVLSYDRLRHLLGVKEV
jgi:NAD(P)H-flavin reductase